MAAAPLFGWMMGAVGADGESDASMYRQLLADAELGHALGYDAAWVVEHHFSDYYPTPSPMVLLANIAARCPGFGLGTAVLVTPWHHPVRLAEEIAMLSLLTDGKLRIGLGRGNAPLEYEAFDVPMDEAKDRFEECWDILRLALAGKPFHARVATCRCRARLCCGRGPAPRASHSLVPSASRRAR